MKRLLAILFLLSLIIAEFGATGVWLKFHVEREQIIKELCIERDLLPEMQTCKGNCYLSKQLKKATHGPDHPADFTIFDYTAELIFEEELCIFDHVIRQYGQDVFLPLSGHSICEEPVPWLV